MSRCEPAAVAAASDAPFLSLEGFEGPLDLLLELARAQKIDLARISILSLVEQFLAVMAEARARRLELAADWLVMAAWLAWLKSRLLLPREEQAEVDAEVAAAELTRRLAELDRMREAAAWLAARPALGQEVFRRGAPESLVAIDRSSIAADLPGLLRAYLAATARRRVAATYRPRALTRFTVQDALARLRRLLGEGVRHPGWRTLEAFVPGEAEEPGERRAALASVLLASLELARLGEAGLRQETPWGPVLVGPAG
jgi:segregation and condensation protein A